MFIILSIIGLLAAAWVWENVNPIAGVVVGFLFVGGLGWNLLGAGLNLLKPSARKAYGPEGREFIAAWEERFGILTPGSSNHPPPGSFQAWLKDNRSTGIDPGPWLDRSYLFKPTMPPELRVLYGESPQPEERALVAWCEMVTDGTEPAVLTSLKVREYGLVLRRITDGGPFADVGSVDTVAELEWEDVTTWQRHDDPKRVGTWVWILTLDPSAPVPSSVIGLAVWDPTDVDPWETELERHMPLDFDEEE